MNSKILVCAISSMALSLLSFTSNAAPVTWQLDATFASNEVLGAGPHDGTASGTFTYDVDTNTYSNINITSTGSNLWGTDNCGDSLLCGTYIRATTIDGRPLDSSNVSLTPTLSDPAVPTGYYGMSLVFASPLGNVAAGTVVNLNTVVGTDGEGICIDPCINSAAGVSAFRGFLSGTVTAVPVPAAVWLFGSGLLGLVGIARRKKA